jgi:hypothetical protein
MGQQHLGILYFWRTFGSQPAQQETSLKFSLGSLDARLGGP